MIDLNSSTLGVFGVVLDRLILLSSWPRAVPIVLTLIYRVTLLSLSVRCRFRPFSDVRTCYPDDSERNMTFWRDPLLSLTDHDAYYVSYDRCRTLWHAYMTLSAVTMVYYDVLPCYEYRFLTYFDRHLPKTVKFNFAAFLTHHAHDCPLSNEPISMSLGAIGDPWGHLMS